MRDTLLANLLSFLINVLQTFLPVHPSPVTEPQGRLCLALTRQVWHRLAQDHPNRHALINLRAGLSCASLPASKSTHNQQEVSNRKVFHPAIGIGVNGAIKATKAAARSPKHHSSLGSH